MVTKDDASPRRARAGVVKPAWATAAIPRVLVVDHTAQFGGGEGALLRVVERLNGERAHIRALTFAAGDFSERLRAAGIHTVVLPLDQSINTTSRTGVLAPLTLLRSLWLSTTFVPALVRAIRGSGADLVVANTLKAALFTSLAAPLAGRRWVWHLHDRLAADYLPAPLVFAMRALAAIAPRAIVVNSEATIGTLPARARRKAVVAHPGLPADSFEPPAEPADPPVVGILGRISPTKGQREFLYAAAEVARAHPRVRFRVLGAALFGEDDYEAEVRTLPERLGIADRVEFTGWVSDPQVRMRELTLLVHASPVAEPFGQVVAEAMAAGVPVIAADAGGVPEILGAEGADSTDRDPDGVRTTRLGILVRPGDPVALAAAIDAALADAGSRAERAAAARAVAGDRFTIDRTATAVWAAWSRALR